MATGSFFLVLKKQRGYGNLIARVAQKSPTLQPGEVCVQVETYVPDALFQRPTLRAKVSIPDDKVASVISADVQENIGQVLSEQLGMKVVISVDEEGRA